MNFPFNINNINDLYKNSESGSGGFFPLGKGVLWHSGIHINSTEAKEVSPIQNGKVILYRLSNNYRSVDLPKVISKEKFLTNETYYSDFYICSSNNKEEYELKENGAKEYVSDCFVMLKHELNIDVLTPNTFVFYTLYMNLEPTAELYSDTKFHIDGKIHFLSDEERFSPDIIGKPGLDKKNRYLDYVLILEKDLKSYSSVKSKNKMLFHGINAKTTLYNRSLIKPINEILSETLFIPRHTHFCVEEYSKDGENLAKLISIKSFRVYLKTKDGLQGEKFKVGNQYVLKDSSKIWFSNGQSIDFSKDSSGLNDKEKYLYELLKNDLHLLQNKSVTVVNVTKNGQPAIHIATSKKKKFWLLNDSGIFAQNDGMIKEDCEVKTYSENPCLYDYNPIETTDELRKSILNIEDEEYKDSKNTVYYRAINKTDSFFITEKDKKDCFKSCYDWDEWFFTYKASNENSLYSENTTLTEPLIEWYEDKRKKYNWITIALAPWWGTLPYLTWKFLQLLYDAPKDIKAAEQMPIEYRKCICKHPIEWDATVIDKLSDTKQDKQNDQITVNTDYISYLKNVAKVTDIWKEGLSKIFKTNSLYFAHPLYFINHFEKCGVFEFNPYEKQFNKLKLTVPANWNESAKKVKYGSSGGTEVLNKDSTLNNPGCAPFTEIAGIEEYAKLSGVFNEDYLTVARYWKDGEPDLYLNYRTKYYHFGVDFSAASGTKVKSFIYGKVVAKGWISTDGRCLLIQRASNNYLYLLCHLSGYPADIAVGKEISPGDIIAYTGTSGATAKKCSEDTFKDAPHLHVSVIKYDKIFVFDECLTDSEKIGTKESTYNWLSSFKKLYVDPFDYTIEWKGMQSIPGKG